MKWTLKTPSKVYPGTIRFVTAFLWLPRKIGKEIRWLERATYSQYFYSQTMCLPYPLDNCGQFWYDIEWL